MKFILNDFPEVESFIPNEGWTPLKESSNLWMIQLQALPFVLINVSIAYFLIQILGIDFELKTTTILISFVIIIPIHEIIHSLFFPKSIFSEEVYFGFTFKGFAPFAFYTEEMSRNRFLVVLTAPFLIITLLGVLYLAIFGNNNLVEHIIIFNALGSSGDCLGVFLLINQVPKNAVIRNKKIKTYWKLQT